MSTDPFNVVKDELKKTVNKTKSLIENYSVLSNRKGKQSVGDDTTRNKLLSDIRTSLKSINWDIQDLDETINIASQNPLKFNLTNNEIESRRQFIAQTKEFVQKTKQTYNIEFDELTTSQNTPSEKKAINNRQANISIKIPDLISNATAKSNNYTKLKMNEEDDESDYEIDTRKFSPNTNTNNSSTTMVNKKMDPFQPRHQQQTSIQLQQEDVFREQDRNLELISGRVSNLKNISQTMQNELDDQANLLDDLGREMDTADSKMQTVMKKITKVLHMSSDKRQWTLIGVLLGAIVFILFLFAIL